MKRTLNCALLIATSLIAISCNGGGGSGEGGSAASTLSQKEMQDYSAVVSEMMKTSIQTLTIASKDGCVLTSKELTIDLTENKNEDITYRKGLESISSPECNGSKFDMTTQVEVYPLDTEESTCAFTGTKNGNILTVTDCEKRVTTVDLLTKTLTSSYTHEGQTTSIKYQATVVDRAAKLNYLANVKIIFYKMNGEGRTVDREVTGNANEILSLGL